MSRAWKAANPLFVDQRQIVNLKQKKTHAIILIFHAIILMVFTCWEKKLIPRRSEAAHAAKFVV